MNYIEMLREIVGYFTRWFFNFLICYLPSIRESNMRTPGINYICKDQFNTMHFWRFGAFSLYIPGDKISLKCRTLQPGGLAINTLLSKGKKSNLLKGFYTSSVKPVKANKLLWRKSIKKAIRKWHVINKNASFYENVKFNIHIICQFRKCCQNVISSSFLLDEAKSWDEYVYRYFTCFILMFLNP